MPDTYHGQPVVWMLSRHQIGHAVVGGNYPICQQRGMTVATLIPSEGQWSYGRCKVCSRMITKGGGDGNEA